MVKHLSIAKRLTIALNPEGWPKILVPAVLGQALGVFLSNSLDLPGFLLPLGFSMASIIYIQLLNDWGDARVDQIKQRLFPTASPIKTVPAGLLPRWFLLGAGLLALVGALICALVLALWLDRPHFLSGALLGVLLFQGYSFSPLKLNYRGGGEVLEMLGLGLLLPWLNAYAQSGVMWHPIYYFLFGLLLLSLASALAGGLADEESDLVGGKRTFTTMLGNESVRKAVARFFAAGLFAWLGTAFYLRDLCPWWLVLVPAASLAYYLRRLQGVSPAATTRAFSAQALYRAYLDHGIWTSTALLALALLLKGRYI